MAKYDLFFDESGISNEPPLSGGTRKADPRPFQLAGILVSNGKATSEISEGILVNAFTSAGLNFKELAVDPEKVHATTLWSTSGQDRYRIIVENIAHSVHQNHWHMVRLVNDSFVGYGDRAPNYVNLVAEMCIRVLDKLSTIDDGDIQLNILGGVVNLETDKSKPPKLIHESKYKDALDEYMAQAVVRRGVAQKFRRWSYTLDLGSAKSDRRLQISDFLCNASFSKYSKCDGASRDALLEISEGYDFEISSSNLLDTIAIYIEIRFVAQAVLLLADDLALQTAPPAERGRKLEECLSILAGMNSYARNSQLSAIDAVLQQRIEYRNDLSGTYRIVLWLLKDVLPNLGAQLQGPRQQDLNWFIHLMQLRAVTIQTHLGATQKALEHVAQMDAAAIHLAGQFDHAVSIITGMVHKAVVLTDAFDYANACAIMKTVDEHYGALADLLKGSLQGVFPKDKEIHSYARGIALGTWLQAEYYAGLVCPERLDTARQLSERAIEEFSSEDDKKRQYEYRCHLETFAGNFDEARHYLAKSIGCAAHDCATLVTAIRELKGMAQGFRLLHWLRIGAEAHRRGHGDEAKLYFDGLCALMTTPNDWLSAKEVGFPVHGVLRYAAFMHAAYRKKAESLQMLDTLFSLADSAGDTTILEVIALAAWSEVWALLREHPSQQSMAKAQALKQSLLDRTRTALPHVNAVVQGISTASQELFDSGFQGTKNSALIKAASKVGC